MCENVTCCSGLEATEKGQRTRTRFHKKNTLKMLQVFKTYIFDKTIDCKVIELDDGGSHTFKERSEDMGTWQVSFYQMSLDFRNYEKFNSFILPNVFGLLKLPIDLIKSWCTFVLDFIFRQ